MNLFRAENPRVVEYFQDHLIDEDDMDQEVMVEMIKGLIVADPSNTQVLVLAEEDNEEIVIRAFSVSFIPQGRRHLFIYQIWADDKLPSKWSEMFFARIRSFAEEKKMTQLRINSTRLVTDLMKAWGFVHHSTLMKFDLEEQ